MKRFLVVGDGLIGAALARYFESRGEVRCTTRRMPASPDAIALDLGKPDDAVAALTKIEGWLSKGSATAFLTAAITGYTRCESDPATSSRINVDNTCLLAEWLLARGAFVVFPSTSAVFGARNDAPAEDIIPAPRTEYGRQKARAETRLLGLRADAGVAVVRMTKVLSRQQAPIKDWLRTLRADGQIETAVDLLMAPISLTFAVSALARVAELRKAGVFHVSGARAVSYRDFGRCFVRQAGISEQRIREIKIHDRTAPTLISDVAMLNMERTSRIAGIMPQPMEQTVEDLLGNPPSGQDGASEASALRSKQE